MKKSTQPEIRVVRGVDGIAKLETVCPKEVPSETAKKEPVKRVRENIYPGVCLLACNVM